MAAVVAACNGDCTPSDAWHSLTHSERANVSPPCQGDALDEAILFDLPQFQLPDDEVAALFHTSLPSAFANISDLQRHQRIAQTKRRSELTTMNDRLLNASIDEPTFTAKQAALRDELTLIEATLAKVATIDATDVRAALAVFEFSQKIPEIWRGSKMLEKRRILETVSLNRVLGDVTLVLEKRKPFDELVKRPQIQLSRGDRI